ncbi:hypothetical protein GWO13_09215 [Candidatus Bathyarchaeota archaeon]|nr:hypothetical protein [Candidatus Bathyarchaeota archaeon]
MPKWLVVARNEYRIHTSRIRKIRPYFPYLIVGLLAVYVAYIAPSFAGLFIDDFIALLLSQAAVAMVQILLFMIFIYFMIIPITQTLREVQAEQLEIFLAAPIKPSDVLLGEFMGEMPFYAIIVTVVAGFFTAVLNPLGLDVVQIAIIIAIFVVTFLSAFWIGNVIAALLRSKFGSTARGRDIGKALALIIALPLVALVYGFQFGGIFEALSDPGASGTVKTVLGLLPSSWGAEVIVGFASNPGNIGAVGFETLTRFGGLLVFFVAVLWLGARVANRAYSLEPTTFSASRAKPDGVFYETVKYLGGGESFGTLLVAIFKDYSRRLENLSKIFYIVGLIVMMNFFIVVPQASGASELGLVMPLMMVQFMFPILAVFVAGEVTLRGKESLFIYRKTPSGVGRFVKARLIQGWLIVVPVAAVVTAFTTLLSPQATFVSLLANTALGTLIAAADISFVLGLFLLMPVFSEKSVRFMLNILIVVFVSMGLFLGSLFGLMGILEGLGTEVGLLYVLLLQTALSWVVGFVFLFLGSRNLSRIE